MGSVAQYIGVTAVTTPAEVERLKQILDLLEWPPAVRFMNGPLISRKTLYGFEPDNRAQYPAFHEIGGLLPGYSQFFNVVHFNSRDPRLANQLGRIAELEGLHGIQLNILWPDPTQLAIFRSQYPDLQLILQISRHCLSSVAGDPKGLAECLKPYEEWVEYGLFDPSGGEGQAFDGAEARRTLEALLRSDLQIHWGVTGGLEAATVGRLQPLLELYPQLCWDAQSRLRDQRAEDVLDLERCHAFLAASLELLG